MGEIPNSLTFLPETRTRAAAPSEREDAFGAVTVPSVLNAGRIARNLASFNYLPLTSKIKSQSAVGVGELYVLGILVIFDDGRGLPARTGDFNRFNFKEMLILGSNLSAFVTLHREIILIFPRESMDFGNMFRRNPHRLMVVSKS